MNPAKFLLLSILSGVLFDHTALAQQPTPAVARIPAGWHVYPTEKLKDVDENTRRCFNYSKNEWWVSSEGDEVKIADRYRPTQKLASPPVPELPPLLKYEAGMPGRTPDAGLSSAMHFKNGWLLAYDAGEWGGACGSRMRMEARQNGCSATMCEL